MDEDTVQRWLDDYVAAWKSYDADAIGALFTDDAEYRWHPWDEGDQVARGRDAIVAAWLGDRDAAGTYDGSYTPSIVSGGTVVAEGRSWYWTDSDRGRLDREYRNLWMLEFDDDARCRSFTEWYMRVPDERAEPPS